MKMKLLLLLIVDEFMKLCFEYCWFMLLMIIHALVVDKCVVMIKLFCFMSFCKNRSQMEKFDFGELEWIEDVVAMN